ncbi:MAG: hypothetical protein ACK4UJ_08305 [Leptonema sp. (in: bacteria)]
MNSKKCIHSLTSKYWDIYKLLTKRLDFRQIRKSFFIVYQINFIRLLFFLFSVFNSVTFLNSKPIAKKNLCKSFDLIDFQNSYMFLNVSLKKSDLLKDESKVIEFANQQFREYLKNIDKIQKQKINKDCLKILLAKEEEIILHFWDLYLETLKVQLEDFLKEKNLYNQEKIFKDFLENQKSLKESYKKKIHFLKQLLYPYDDPVQYKEIEETAKKWNTTFYIVLFYTLFHLPEDFKKEWFNKF